MMTCNRAVVFSLPLVGVILLGFYVFPLPNRSVETFATANGLTLDQDTRTFVTFHLARMQVLRQWGAVAGLIVGTIAGSLFHRTDSLWFVFALVGSLAGMAIAEAARFVRSPTHGTARFAELERRDRSRYLSKTSRWVEWMVLVAFTASAVVAIASRSHSPLWARAGVVLAGFVVIAGGRRVGRHVAIRSVDPTNAERRRADEALRRAAVNVVAAIVASTTLCATAWLLATPIKHTTLTVQFGVRAITRIDNIGFPWEVAPTEDPKAARISWRNPTTGATQSTVVPRPSEPSEGETVETSSPSVERIRDLASGAAGWFAFIEWLEISRIPFRIRRKRFARARLVGMSA